MTMQNDLGVEVVRAYEFRQVGQIFFPPAMLRERLVKLGFVKPVAAKPAGKTRAFASPVDRMVRSAPVNK